MFLSIALIKERAKEPDLETTRCELMVWIMEAPPVVGRVEASSTSMDGLIVGGVRGVNDGHIGSKEIPYHDMTPVEFDLPPRQSTEYKRPKMSTQRFVPEIY